MADGVLFDQEALNGVVRDLRARADAADLVRRATTPDAGRTTNETSAAIDVVDAAKRGLARELDSLAGAIERAVEDLLAVDAVAAGDFSGMTPL